MAAFSYQPDTADAWIEECGPTGDGCTLCGGKHDASACPVFPETETPTTPQRHVCPECGGVGEWPLVPAAGFDLAADPADAPDLDAVCETCNGRGFVEYDEPTDTYDWRHDAERAYQRSRF